MQFPASVVQKQMWLLHSMFPASSAYNIPSLFRVTGDFQPETMLEAINSLASRHPVFRTTFQEIEGELLQVVHDAPGWYRTLNVDAETANSHGAGRGQELPWDWIYLEVSRPFDLAEGPLLRVSILERNANEYLLLIVMHHIITDLRSKEMMARELENLYNCALTGTQMPAQPAPFSYPDFALQDQIFRETQEHGIRLKHWEMQVTANEGPLDLPLDYPRPSVLGQNGNARPILLDPELTLRLNEWSKAHGTRNFQTLLAAYFVLLHVYCGKDQIVVGVPLSNRRPEDRKNLMGCLMNILPLTVDFSGSPDFVKILDQVKKAMLLAHRNQEVWYKTIVDECRVPRDPGRNPIFQAGFTFEQPMTLRLHGLKVEPLKVHNGGAQLDVFPVLWEAGDRIEGFFEYNTHLFRGETIDRYVANFHAILDAVLSGDASPISRMSVISAQERKLQLGEWNSTGVHLPDGLGVGRLIELQAEKTPDAISIRFAGRETSYRELNSRANQLARFLASQGVQKGSLVGVHLERSDDLLVALLGVLKAGCGYLPLDPHFPADRLQYMIELAEVPLVLTSRNTREILPVTATRAVCFDEITGDLAGQDPGNPGIAYSPADPAYVIFTSGSTGKPKGVMISHGAMVNFLLSMAAKPGIAPDDVLLAVTSLSFDISVLELFLPLIVGATVLVAAGEDVVDGERLLGLIKDHGVSLMQATPTTWRLLIGAGWTRDNPLKVLCGGEAMPEELARGLLSRAAEVWNMYGPTETTVWSTCHKLSPSDSAIYVGRPIWNTQVYILNKGLSPVPIGAIGELFIGGAGLSDGYFKRPDLTASAFLAAPHGTESGSVLYKTGDLARYHPGGIIEILGRIDHQVKIRGYRIELGEIEKVLETHGSLRQAVVVAAEREPGQMSLVAYLIGNPGQELDHAELRDTVASALPDYMVPTAFVNLAEMPLTPNGKVDRKKLPAPDFSRSAATTEYLSPTNDLERRIAGIWQEALKITQVGLRDRFFDIGGNSLLAVQVTARLKEALGQPVSVVTLFQHPTIESLAHHLSGVDSGTKGQDQALSRAQMKRNRSINLRNRPRGR